MKIIRIFAFAQLFFWSYLSQAQVDLGDFGITGLIDMPSARMQPDGNFGFSYVRQDVADTFALTYQATPWLETSFRYHIQSPREELWNYYDRSYEIKARLLKESGWYPQIAVGIRDLLGTGIYSGEYLVGSKTVGNFDATLGFGWGRLAGHSIGRNPLTYISDSFDERDAETGLGGELRGGDYFSGRDVGVFGGVQYDVPDWKLNLIVEYNSDRYQREIDESNSIDLQSAWSFGLNWEAVEDVTIGLSWQHGSELGLRFTSSLDSRGIVPRRVTPLVITSEGEFTANYAQQQVAPEWYNRLAFDAAQAGLWLKGASVIDGQAILEYENDRYQLQTDAAEKLIQLAELHLPQEIQTMTLVYSENNMRPFSIQYLRRDWSSIYELASGQSEIRDAMIFLPAPDWSPDIQTKSPFQIGTSANIRPRFSFFDPDNPAWYQFYLGLNAYSDLGNGWRLQGGLAINLLTNFDEITRESDSVLPHVRSDVDKYLKEGKSGLQYLFVDKHGQLAEDVYYRGFVGYLEEMYAGLGGEVLYRPFRSRWALGLNIIGAHQRDYGKGFDFLDYQITTGQMSLYWASPSYNYDVALHIGRYLAGDWGQTIEIKRRFANGWEVGAFATFTDVSAEEFGEGSFDKGISLRIPLSSFISGNSRKTALNTTIRPLTRDGGQRLDSIGTTLWDTLRTSNYDELTTAERLNH